MQQVRSPSTIQALAAPSSESPEHPRLPGKQWREHDHRSAQPRLVGDHRNVAAIVPVLEPECAVVPQRFKLKAGKVLADDIKQSDRPLGHHLLSLGNERAVIILVRHFSRGWIARTFCGRPSINMNIASSFLVCRRSLACSTLTSPVALQVASNSLRRFDAPLLDKPF